MKKSLVTLVAICVCLVLGGKISAQQNMERDIALILDMQKVLGMVINLATQYDENVAKFTTWSQAIPENFEGQDLDTVNSIVQSCDSKILPLLTMQQNIFASVKKMLKQAKGMEKKLKSMNTPNSRKFLQILNKDGGGLKAIIHKMTVKSPHIAASVKKMRQGCNMVKSGLRGLEAYAKASGDSIVSNSKYGKIRAGQNAKKVFKIMGSEGSIDYQTDFLSIHSWRELTGAYLQVTMMEGIVFSKSRFKF